MTCKVFVTVGTTSFDQLLREIDGFSESLDMTFTFQIGPSNYIPRHGVSKRYFNNFQEYYSNSDIVVTHAGAGSVYTLLELGIHPIVVANLDRADKHQMDLVKFVGDNSFGVALTNVKTLKDAMANYHGFRFDSYSKTDFFVAPQIIEMISASICRN